MMRRLALFERMVDPDAGGFSADLAKYVLSFGFLPGEQGRYEELSIKAQEGTLSGEEAAEFDEFIATNDFVSILKSKARVSLRQQGIAVSA